MCTALGKRRHIPPSIEDVKIYFNQKGIPEQEAIEFFFTYKARQWTSKRGNYVSSWKDTAYKWIASLIEQQPLLFDRHIH